MKKTNLAKLLSKEKEFEKAIDEHNSRNNITTFNTGAIRDTQSGKTDFTETISFTAHNRYAKYMTKKKEKYGAGNFKKGIPIESYEQSLLRHIDKYFRNKYENGNDEKEEDHLAAMRFNVDGIMHEEEMAKLLNK